MSSNHTFKSYRCIYVVCFLNFIRFYRCSLRIKQCIKAVQHLSTTTTSLPLVNFSSHQLSRLSKHKLYMKFRTHSLYYLVRSTVCGQHFAICVINAVIVSVAVVVVVVVQVLIPLLLLLSLSLVTL